MHLKLHKECPAEIKRRKSRGSVLDDVKKQFDSGAPAKQAKYCLPVGLEDTLIDVGRTSDNDKTILLMKLSRIMMTLEKRRKNYSSPTSRSVWLIPSSHMWKASRIFSKARLPDQ